MQRIESLQSVQGRFLPRLALLLFPEESEDQEHSVILHELAHADTFLGSAYYGAYAARALVKDDFSIQQHIVDFAEAVPSILAALGGRHLRGTSPDIRAIDALREAVDCYRHCFMQYWVSKLQVPSDEALPLAYLFDKTVVMAIVRAALARAEMDEQRTAVRVHPLDVIRDLTHRLKRITDPLASVAKYDDIEDHVELLTFGSSVSISTMFGPQIKLLHVLVNSSESLLRDNFVLLAVIARLDFAMQAWQPHHTVASFFVDQSKYHHARLQRWMHRVGAVAYRPGTLAAMEPLRFCFRPPVEEHKMVVPRLLRDPVETDRAILLWNRYKVRKFFHALPDFIGWFVDKTIWRSTHHHTDIVKRLCDEAATVYLVALESRIAEWQNRTVDKSAGSTDRLFKLVPANDPAGNTFLELVPL